METNRKGETPMAVFRVEKTRNYTVMSNHPLRDKSLSLKAKGLLSLMLSLPEEWDYTTKGLAYICKDGVDSIESTGIAEPLIVRPRSGGGYEIISGHRRDYCAKVVGLETRPVIVRNYSDEDADVLVVDYNINRENLLPSEKAKAYKLKLDAMRRTAGRPAKNSGQLGQNFQGRASVDILAEQADENSLALFDELGAGTDPTEGAALAIAILNELHSRGTCTMATTHYSELKVFALTTPGVENGCCEFDVATLRPTYRLLIGIPGKSNAFAIAARLGLQPTIIDRAKEQVSTEDARFEDVLAELERERRRIEKMKEEAQRMRSAAQSERDRMRAERDAAEERADKMMEGARSQADNILKNARMTAETVFDELETLKKQSQKKASEQNLAAAKAALRGVITQTENEQRRGIQKRVVDAEEVRPLAKGDRVRLLNVGGVIATVLAVPDRDGSVQVQAGPMKMTVKENELRLVEEKKNAPKPKPQPRRDAPRRELNIRSAESEVDVRGMSAEEALFEVDNFLSRAIMAGLPSVTVIHGKGTGVLRTAVQQHLRKNKRVKSVRSGVYGEGEQGVTIVELR